MFKCASLAHPCASVACCQTKFQVPLTAFIMHPYFDEPYRHLVKHWKDCFYLKKKNKLLSNCGILWQELNVLSQNKILSFKSYLIFQLLVVEQTDSGKAHHHTIFVTGFDYMVITDRSARLCYILHATSVGALDVISKWEERIRAQRYSGILI